MSLADAQCCAECADCMAGMAEIEAIIHDRLAAVEEELERMRARCAEAERLAGRRLDRIYQLVCEVHLAS